MDNIFRQFTKVGTSVKINVDLSTIDSVEQLDTRGSTLTVNGTVLEINEYPGEVLKAIKQTKESV